MMRTFERIRADLRSGAASCESITAEYLAAIERGRNYNAFLSVFPDKAIARAREVDRKLAKGTAGPLAGMVVAVKDVIC
ncbi:MAG: Asp-tRNA(Asn)/Glu-tRNA(Gln) amidotransferase subunit GatA, partial [Ignavibacteriales bacterium]|nr:Asp-tRNA(Asn)/Glu-tRNA(Gln) amidotransferase subunit GatA [Ignavibacteriales bacterium]